MGEASAVAILITLRSKDIHARIGSSWPLVLAQLGIAESHLRLKKSGPCPACGGTDRYVFDNRKLKGDYYCRNPGCGPGDGFKLLMRVYGWNFEEAFRRVVHAAGLSPGATPNTARFKPSLGAPVMGKSQAIVPPTAQVLRIIRESCSIADCPDAIDYLASRRLWPLPSGAALLAHVGLEYWDAQQRIGRYAALVAEVRDIDDELVTAHVTYLQNGMKLLDRKPRKLLSKLEGRVGSAIRLMPVCDTLAIAEGIETALSAAVLFNVPAWAAVNAGMLAKFEPPPGVTKLVICADRDVAGLIAASRLMERMQGRVSLELRIPKAPAKDFNDELNAPCPGDHPSP